MKINLARRHNISRTKFYCSIRRVSYGFRSVTVIGPVTLVAEIVKG